MWNLFVSVLDRCPFIDFSVRGFSVPFPVSCCLASLITNDTEMVLFIVIFPDTLCHFCTIYST